MTSGAISRSFCGVCLCAGPSFLAIALGFAIYTAWFLHGSVAANGTVVGMRTTTDAEDNSVTYAPVFSFAASDGNTYTVSSDTGSNPPGFELKQQVKVLYEEGRPTNAKIATFGQLWLFPLLFGIVGATAIAVGFFLLRYERRRNPQFKVFSFGNSVANAQDARAALLGGPKVDDFDIERSRDTGRPVDL
jgi:hypothetical protein